MKKAFRRRPVAFAVSSVFGTALIFGLSSSVALAQEKIERIEITGSAIKRSINDETPLPVTVIDVKQLRETGVTSVEEAMTRITAMQSTQGSNQAIGLGTGGKAVADLRGLGSNKTLVLLNGRRLASFAFDSASVDLNAIPLAVVDRIEVLRDGASAIYGTDAIGGVINFITKTNFDKGELAVEMSQPQMQGGATNRFTLSKGIGNMNTDGYNVWASFDSHTQDVVTALDRKFGESGVVPSRGLNKTSGTTFPANWTDPTAGTSGNPTRATGCNPPGSLALAPTTCRYDYTSQIDLVAPTTTDTLMARGGFKLGSHVASIEVLHTENTNTSKIAPDPQTGLTMTSASSFFPAGADPANPISVAWRMGPAGKRTTEADSSMDRAVATLSGSLSSSWDYNAGLFWTQSKVAEKVTDGYVSSPLIRAGVAAGTLNPFANPTPAQAALLQAAKVIGISDIGKGSTSGADFRVSGEPFQLPGGKLGLSAGVEMRKEKYQQDTNDEIVNAALSLGRSPSHVTGNRDVKAITLEAVVPVHKMLEFQLAVRSDSYSDVGRTTNPKVGFKFRPVDTFMIRGSKNKGFRAPTLDDLHGPQTITYSGNAYNDPILCPGGVVAAGGVATRDCGQQVQAQIGGNPNLKAETSDSHSYGFVLQPTKDIQFSMDYWNVELKNTLLAYPEQTVINNNDLTRIFRCNTLSAAVQNTLDRCSGLFANSNAIGYINTLTDNVGAVKTNGIDIAGSFAFNAGAVGRLALNYNGTRVNSYKYQRNPTDPFTENVGIYGDTNPVFRWQHLIGVNHQLHNFSTWLIIRSKSGYTDQNAGGEGNYVPSYTVADLATTYTGFKGFTLTAGIKNVLNQDPPFSNQALTFQQGYDPRFTDPIGRAYFVRGSYQF